MWDTLRPPSEDETKAFYDAGWWRTETFLDDLERNARERPDHPAVIAYSGGVPDRTLSWAEYQASVTRCAAALTELGVGRGDVVAVYLPNRWLLGPLYLACARIGAVSSPVIPVLAGRELAYVLDASKATVCVTVDSFGGVDYDRRLAEVAPATLKHRVVVGDASRTGALDFEEFFVRTAWEQRHPLDGIEPGGADDPVLLLYTSGTTGAMKAVVHSQNTLYAAARTVAESQGLSGDDVISVPNFLTHMAGSSFAVSLPVLLGATTVMQDNNTDMELFLDLVERHRITWAYLSPSYLVNLLRIQRDKPRDTASLHRIVSGSAPVQPDLIAEVRTVLDVPAHTLWGMTENGGVTLTRPGDPEGWGAQSDGSPMPWMQVKIAIEAGGDVGRLLVRGASQTLGYLGQRDLYESTVDSEGWFDTGDLARVDGRGGIRITGRRNDLITRASGQKVSTLEVETILMRHPSVTDVVLVGYPDPAVPAADLVCAVVVPDGRPPTVGELREYLQDQGVAPVLCPDRVQFVWELPKNSLGKVLREPLRRRLEVAAGIPS
ncbi:MAG TPA: AMP-binding protein [Mycobacteriales bacterium]|nr:AMP-binding protein [Mycobacteriales bacterium]